MYRFLNKDGEIIYIGRTINIHQRINQHKTTGGVINRANDEVNNIEYVKCSSHTEMVMLELYLIDKYKPKYNIADLYENESINIFQIKDNLVWIEYNKYDFIKRKSKVKNGVLKIKCLKIKNFCEDDLCRQYRPDGTHFINHYKYIIGDAMELKLLNYNYKNLLRLLYAINTGTFTQFDEDTIYLSYINDKLELQNKDDILEYSHDPGALFCKIKTCKNWKFLGVSIITAERYDADTGEFKISISHSDLDLCIKLLRDELSRLNYIEGLSALDKLSKALNKCRNVLAKAV